METESQWWKGQLAADIHQALRIKELKLPVYHAHSPQIGMRRYFADLLAILSNRYQLCATARHLAVYLLDLFMDHYDVAIKQLYVIALSCLLLASKFEEKEDRVPKLEQLNSLGIMCSLNLVLNKRDLIKMELLLLETFNWNLCIPTPAHFIDYYLQASVQEGDLYNSWPLTSLSKTKAFMDKYTHYFLEVSLQDHAFLSFRPSQVAAACVAASRICLQITPSWTTALHLLTGYTWDHLTKCIELMLLAHDNDVKEANKSKSPHPSSQVSLQPVAQHMHLSPVSAVQRPTLTPSSLSSSSSSSSVSSASQPLLFQARDYPHLSQHSPSLAQLHALAAAAASAEPQALGAMVPQDFLHSHSRMAMLPGSEMAAALPSYQSLPAGLQTGPRTLALQGPISMQVAIAAEPPRHCMSVAAYAAGGYLGAHPTFSAGCFNR